MSYPRHAVERLSFDPRLLGGADRFFWELGFKSSVRMRGWQVIYNPAVSLHPRGVCSADRRSGAGS
jgi:hypothetical protein